MSRSEPHKFRTAVLLLVGLHLVPCAAQQSAASAKDFQNADLTRTTTYVIPTGNKDQDAALQKAVEENWTFSTLGSLEDLKGATGDTRAKRTYISYGCGPVSGLCSIVMFGEGSQSASGSVDPADILSRSWMDYFRPGVSDYLLPLLVETLQQNLRLRMAPAKGYGRTDETDINLLTHRLKGKKLLFIPKAEKHVEELEMLKKHYEQEVMIVDRMEAAEAIAARRTDEALLVLCDAYPWVFVYDLGTRECIFWGTKKTHEQSVKYLNSLTSK